MAIPDEKYQNSPTGGQAFPDGGAKPPLWPPPCSAAPVKIETVFVQR